MVEEAVISPELVVVADTVRALHLGPPTPGTAVVQQPSPAPPGPLARALLGDGPLLGGLTTSETL